MSNLVPYKNANGNFQICFNSPISIDNGYTNEFQGNFKSTMELFVDKEGKPSMIEWDVPELETTEHIGLEISQGVITGYDGVFEIPKEAIVLLEGCGYKVDDDLKNL